MSVAFAKKILSGILLLQRKKREFLFEVLFTMIFGCVLALKQPGLDNVTPIEYILFYVEHIIPILTICYFHLIYFKDTIYLSPKRHLISFTIFSLYQRTILFPLSEWSWVNLNYTLCGHPNDPFFKKFGKGYLILSELYLSFGSLMIKIILSYCIKKLETRRKKTS